MAKSGRYVNRSGRLSNAQELYRVVVENFVVRLLEDVRKRRIRSRNGNYDAGGATPPRRVS